MDVRGCVEADAGVLVVMVVPVHEATDESPGVVHGCEAFGEFRTVFQGLEQGLAVRVVVGHPWSGVGPGDLQIREQRGHRFGGH